MQGWIFRFVSILGEGYTHGHIVDFYEQPSDQPGMLCILGNGKQPKQPRQALQRILFDCSFAVSCFLGNLFSRADLVVVISDQGGY